MKIVIEMENIQDVQQAVRSLVRGFPEAFALDAPAEQAPDSGLVAPDGRPAAQAAQESSAIVTPSGEPAKKTRSRKAEPAAPAPAASEAPQFTLEQVRAAAREIKKQDGSADLERVRATLGKFGATRIDGLKPEQYAAFIEALQS
jgi:hypothetical protein